MIKNLKIFLESNVEMNLNPMNGTISMTANQFEIKVAKNFLSQFLAGREKAIVEMDANEQVTCGVTKVVSKSDCLVITCEKCAA
jgi:hypothetical protein